MDYLYPRRWLLPGYASRMDWGHNR